MQAAGLHLLPARLALCSEAKYLQMKKRDFRVIRDATAAVNGLLGLDNMNVCMEVHICTKSFHVCGCMYIASVQKNVCIPLEHALPLPSDGQ